jgi:hypothetical protein
MSFWIWISGAMIGFSVGCFVCVAMYERTNRRVLEIRHEPATDSAAERETTK